jgi:hypothetical protein
MGTLIKAETTAGFFTEKCVTANKEGVLISRAWVNAMA